MTSMDWFSSPLDVRFPIRNLDRFFLDALADIDTRVTERVNRTSELYTPNIDIAEDADNFYILAEVPGLTKADISVMVRNNKLTIRGTKVRREEKRERTHHRIERSFGEFIRSMPMPTNVRSEAIAAQVTDGLLEITLPKLIREASSVREIPLNATMDDRSSIAQSEPNGQVEKGDRPSEDDRSSAEEKNGSLFVV